MDSVVGGKSSLALATRISTLAIVALWLFPTVGLLVSSFRTADQIAASGWWASIFPAERNLTLRTAPPSEIRREGDSFVLEGNLFELEGRDEARIGAWGVTARDVDAYAPGETAEFRSGGEIAVMENGDYRAAFAEEPDGSRGPRVFVTAVVPPEFTLKNYELMLFDDSNVEGMAGAFFNTLTVTIPATVIPILVAAFAAYALAWMEFPGRVLPIAAVVGLLVVPLQLALIPLLKLHNGIGIGKGYLGVWLAHTGFGLPLAIYLLRNYMASLPRDIIECARVDGATDFQIFGRIVLPLSFPALASFAILQFLWTWNDLLVAKVFLIDATGQTTVLTNRIVELLGTRGGNWEILATAAFVSIAAPLAVFFAMQKYLVRGLLAGSVK